MGKVTIVFSFMTERDRDDVLIAMARSGYQTRAMSKKKHPYMVEVVAPVAEE